jgi:hypothetical protein
LMKSGIDTATMREWINFTYALCPRPTSIA